MGPTSGLKKANTRSEYWRNAIQQQTGSGQPVTLFCAKRGLTEQSFYYWKKRLSKEAPVSFALVSAADEPASKPNALLELELGSGQRLRIPRGVDVATLRTVLMVLREQS